MLLRRLSLAMTVAAATLVLAACGDEATPSQDAGGEPAEHANGDGMQHIHGLGVRGGTLYIATHNGLWAAEGGQTRAQRVGESQQDVMGFSVVRDDLFIGSGHPHPSQDLPSNLGLIESRDGGRTWKSVSLMGEADFHALESSGPRIYGFDGTEGRLMASSDNGRTWQQRTPPAAVFALAIDPADKDHIVVSTERGVFMSPNAGKGWRPLDARLAGLLAWPRADTLYLIDGDGQVRASRDSGRQWASVGSIGGQPAAFIAHGDDLYAALTDGSVKQSSDGGRSWTVRATP